MNARIRVLSPGIVPLLAFVLVVLIIIIIIPLLILGVAGAALSRLGFSWIEAVAALLLMLAGSLVNIPLRTFRIPQNTAGGSGPVIIDAFTGEPVDDGYMATVLSLNVGGAVIPSVICGYLLHENIRLESDVPALPIAACFLIVSLVTFLLIKTPTGMGLRAPLILPGLSALACGVFLTGGTSGLSAGVTAFIGGTMGILCGATAFGMVKGIHRGIGQISIGGSGMFGSVLTCAVLSALAA